MYFFSSFCFLLFIVTHSSEQSLGPLQISTIFYFSFGSISIRLWKGKKIPKFFNLIFDQSLDRFNPVLTHFIPFFYSGLQNMREKLENNFYLFVLGTNKKMENNLFTVPIYTTCLYILPRSGPQFPKVYYVCRCRSLIFFFPFSSSFIFTGRCRRRGTGEGKKST